MKFVFLVFMAVMMSACSRPDTAREVLHSNGYTNINMNGWSLFGCDEKDSFVDSFEATSPNGTRVKGVVCGGVFKGSTIRFN